jgi:hypothetical protein
MSQLEQAVAAIAQQTVANMLPQIVAAVQGQMGTQGVAVGAGTNLAAAQVAQPAPDPFGGLGAATVQPTVTPQMVQELITPYLANEQHKQAFIAQMPAIPRLTSFRRCTPVSSRWSHRLPAGPYNRRRLLAAHRRSSNNPRCPVV